MCLNHHGDFPAEGNKYEESIRYVSHVVYVRIRTLLLAYVNEGFNPTGLQIRQVKEKYPIVHVSTPSSRVRSIL